MLVCATTRISQRKRLQFCGRRALARKVSERYQCLGVHARVIVVEQLAQLWHHSIDFRMLWPEAPQVPRRQTPYEVGAIARRREQSGNGEGVFRFDSRQGSGCPYADEAH